MGLPLQALAQAIAVGMGSALNTVFVNVRMGTLALIALQVYFSVCFVLAK